MYVASEDYDGEPTGTHVFAAAPVLFPAPPPTINALTVAQRARLVRSSNKLGRILGTTPHFIDCESVEETTRGSMDTASSSRASFDSESSTSSLSRSSSMRSRKSLPPPPHAQSARRQSTDGPVRKASNSTPMLRLALTPMLAPIPASPLSPHHHAPAMSLTLDAPPASSPDDYCDFALAPEHSPTAPTFTILTPTATRRRKMDKLRRTLGDEVPLALVFPSFSSCEYDSDYDSSRSVSPSPSPSASESEESLETPTTSPLAPTTPLDAESCCDSSRQPAPAPAPVVRLRTTPPRKITHARDSLYVLRLQKTFVPPPAPKAPKVPIPQLTASRPAPPPPPGATKERVKRSKRKAPTLPAPPPVPSPSYNNLTSYSNSGKPATSPNTPLNTQTQKPTRRRASNPPHPPVSPSSEYACSSSPSTRRHSPTPSLAGSALGMILECPESEWFDDGDDQDSGDGDKFEVDLDFDLVDEDEVVEAAMWGWGTCVGAVYGEEGYRDAYVEQVWYRGPVDITDIKHAAAAMQSHLRTSILTYILHLRVARSWAWNIDSVNVSLPFEIAVPVISLKSIWKNNGGKRDSNQAFKISQSRPWILSPVSLGFYAILAFARVAQPSYEPWNDKEWTDASPSSASLMPRAMQTIHSHAVKHTRSLAQDLRVAFASILVTQDPSPNAHAIYCKPGKSGILPPGGGGQDTSPGGTSAPPSSSAGSTVTRSSSSSGPKPTGNVPASSPWKLTETHVRIQYVLSTRSRSLTPRFSKRANGILDVNGDGNAIMRVETTPNVPNTRKSIRITTQSQFNGGLVIMDSVHMPTGCGIWPAFWTNGPNWPVGGEIDIVEGVHDYTNNQATIHTRDGCRLPSSNSNVLRTSGAVIGGTDCNVDTTGNQGCGIRAPTSNSFGAGFNRIGGGTYASTYIHQKCPTLCVLNVSYSQCNGTALESLYSSFLAALSLPISSTRYPARKHGAYHRHAGLPTRAIPSSSSTATTRSSTRPCGESLSLEDASRSRSLISRPPLSSAEIGQVVSGTLQAFLGRSRAALSEPVSPHARNSCERTVPRCPKLVGDIHLYFSLPHCLRVAL
ncbi:hypothetical protein DXG03_004480 [Asterophora parasitica]|uniref:GH16 domain-containing protein n=1 Tax=Asterophora parasitica TaxID=117018 RepID=A0A9P7GF73_9AGAR|nr:hypothetical protein DXG03_004480 [Asterophora parasitica]